MCCGKENATRPKLLLGARQRFIPELDGVEHIVLVHHPMAWLRDGEDTQRYIDNRARIPMCGHEHKPNVNIRTSDDGHELLVVDAGATEPDKVNEEYTYAFNVIEIDLADMGDAVNVVVDTYKWREAAVSFAQHLSRHEDGEPKVYTLPCPRFAAAPAMTAGRAASSSSSRPLFEGDSSEADAGEPVANVEAIGFRSDAKVAPSDVRGFAQVRNDFFHRLSVAQRVAVLVRLEALPEGLDSLSSNIMLRQLNKLNREGRPTGRVRARRDTASDGQQRPIKIEPREVFTQPVRVVG